MKYVFKFHGGPLDGNALVGDEDAPKTPLDFAEQAFRETAGGEIGKEFVVENPDTPHDEHGVIREFRRHVYVVEQHETSTTGKLLIHSRHVRALPPGA